MAQRKPSQKKLKIVNCLVGADPSLATAAAIFLYPWDRLEYLAANLNDVAPDSSQRFIVDLVERLLACPPARQDWIKQANLAPIIGPTPCTPAPGSPLYVLNKFLQDIPCFLRIEGVERASGKIEVRATHMPFSRFLLTKEEMKKLGLSERVIENLGKVDYEEDRIMWLLWEALYHGVDLARLKKCPVCHRWFVDHTKRRNKLRCTAACTTRRWSWEARKEAGHNLPGGKSARTRGRGRRT